MVQDRNGEQDKFKKIHPSIFIGLGGTGKHILLSLRKKLFEKFELTKGFPIMEFLWIDTDMQNIGIDGKELDYTLEQVKFQPDEIVDLQVPESTFKGYISYKQDYPHLWEWLPHTIEAAGPPKNGAKQIRPLGRLGFFYKYDEIVAKLDFLKSKIASRENINKTQEMGIEVDATRTDIYVVFSIAGGTGSGIFMDMAFTLKEHFTSGMTSIGYVVLPSVFWHDRSHRIFANSYAALKELEFYSLRKDFLNKDEAMAHETRESQHDFLCWYSAKSRQKRVVGPPFDIVYLIDNQTSQGFTINLDNKDQLMDMIAEDIFLQFASPAAFGSIVKSVQANAHALLEHHYVFEISDEKRKGEAKYKNAYSRHFASMGLSKIYIPIDRIRRACALKLAMRIIEDWTAGPRKAPNIHELVEKELYDHLRFSRGETGKTILDRINRFGEKTFENAVDEWIHKLNQRMSPKFEKGTPGVEKEITDIYEQYIKEHIKQEAGRKGILVKGIETNVANLIKEIQNGILSKTNNILSEPQFRFDVAKKMLLYFKERLEFMRQTLEKNRNEMKKNIDSKYMPAFKKALTTYSDVERRFTYLKNTTLKKLGAIMIDKLRLWLINEVRGLLMEGTIAVIESLSGYVGFSKTEQNKDGEIVVTEAGLVKKLSDVENTLKKDILGSLQYKYRSFAGSFQEHINVSLYREDLVENYFEIDGKAINDEMISDIGKEFLAEIGIELIGLIDHFVELGKERLQLSLEEFSDKKFVTIKQKHEAIRLLYDDTRCTPDERKRLIANFIGNGHPWIKPTGTFLGANESQLFKDIQKYSVLGVYPGKHDSYRYFQDDVRAQGISLDRFQVADSEKSVAYFYTEWVAFPIMYIEGIREWYERAYIAYMEKSDENLHIEKYYHKYDELIAISYDDLNIYLDAYEKLILGFILGVIDINEEKERRTFHYTVQWEASPGVFHSRKIGDEYFAIKRLEGSSDMKREITDRITKKKMKMEMDTELLWNYYSLLRYYWKDVFPLRYRGSKADPVEIESYEYRVILNEMQTVGNKLKKAMETAGYTEELMNQEFNNKFESHLLNLDMFSRQVGDTKRRVLKG